MNKSKMGEPEKEFETVYLMTAPFANSEEEIATSYIVHDNASEDQVIVLNDDCSIVINKDTTFVDEDGNPVILNRKNGGKENEFTVVIKEENESRDATEDNSPNDPQGKSSVEQDIKSENDSNEKCDDAQQENVSMELDQSSSVERNENLVSEQEHMEHQEASNGVGSSVMEPQPISILKRDETSFLESTACSSLISMSDRSEKRKHFNKPERVKVFIPDNVEVDKLTCRYCLKTYSKESNKMRHIRKIHKVRKNIGTCIRCIECNISFNNVQKLRDHLQTAHRLNMNEEELYFPNMLAFKKWKHDIERKELMSFTIRHGARKTTKGRKYFYACHRSGKYETRVSGKRQRMLKTAGTCKLGIVCTAAVYCEERPNEVYVKYCSHHYGHGKETSFVQLSTAEQNAIQENISNGIPFENLLGDMREGTTNDHFQMGILKKKDIKFINNAFSAEEYNPGLSDAESVDRWVRLCCQMEDSPVLYYRQEESGSEEEFLLIMMTEFQKQILLSSERQIVCVDSLYRRKGGRFYLTCLFVMDECDTAFPVAFCISNKVDKSVIKQFLLSIKESTGPLSCTYFMSDSERFYYEAWREIMNDESKWLWSIWYVDNRVRVQLRCFKGNVVKRADVYRTMRMLLECQSPNVFETMFKNYIDSLMSDSQSKNLGNFVLQKYGNSKEMWANCYWKDVKLSTLIHLESLHRTLRYCCREGRKKRLDKFIFVIMKLVRYKMLGRLASILDEEKISLAIEAIDMCHSIGLEIPPDCISSLSDKIWLVKSEDEEENVYVVREFDACPEHCTLRCSECDICVHMFSCSCMHSMINANLCQHIHAVVWKFLTPHFSPLPSPSRDDSEEIENIDVSIPLKKSSGLFESVLKRTHDVFKKVRSNKCTLSKESMTAVMKRLNECIDICSGKKVKEDQSGSNDKNSTIIVNPFVKSSQSQQLILPNQLPAMSHQNKPLSQYVLLLPNNLNNGTFVQK